MVFCCASCLASGSISLAILFFFFYFPIKKSVGVCSWEVQPIACTYFLRVQCLLSTLVYVGLSPCIFLFTALQVIWGIHECILHVGGIGFVARGKTGRLYFLNTICCINIYSTSKLWIQLSFYMTFFHWVMGFMFLILESGNIFTIVLMHQIWQKSWYANLKARS